jgi:hypothetical protein
MNDLRPVADRRTPTSVATQQAVAVEEDSSPRLETTIRMQPRTTAVALHNALHQVEGVSVCPVGRACVEFLCTYSIGALGVSGHSRVWMLHSLRLGSMAFRGLQSIQLLYAGYT